MSHFKAQLARGSAVFSNVGLGFLPRSAVLRKDSNGPRPQFCLAITGAGVGSAVSGPASIKRTMIDEAPTRSCGSA